MVELEGDDTGFGGVRARFRNKNGPLFIEKQLDAVAVRFDDVVVPSQRIVIRKQLVFVAERADHGGLGDAGAARIGHNDDVFATLGEDAVAAFVV